MWDDGVVSIDARGKTPFSCVIPWLDELQRLHWVRERKICTNVCPRRVVYYRTKTKLYLPGAEVCIASRDKRDFSASVGTSHCHSPGHDCKQEWKIWLYFRCSSYVMSNAM